MNAPFKNPWILAFLVGAVLVTLTVPFFRHVPPAPAMTGSLPAWRLQDEAGRPLGSAELSGHVVVMAFVSQGCRSACERVGAGLASLSRRFDEVKAPVDIVVVVIDSDPGAITPASRAAWASRVMPGASRLHVAGGPRQDTCPLVLAAFGARGKAAGCERLHALADQARLVLVDGQGHLRGDYGSDGLGLDETFHRALAVLENR